MANYNQNEISSMRQDAIRRTREMQRQAVNYSDDRMKNQNRNNDIHNGEYSSANLKQSKNNNFTSADKHNECNIDGNLDNEVLGSYDDKKRGDKSNIINGLLKDFFPGKDGKFDSEKILILALIFILSKDGADLKLMLALGYILL